MVGRPWQQGSLPLIDEVAKYDHPIIERIQNAGGIIHIRTATPEFSCAGFTHSKLWGVTRNPWNPEFTPGRVVGWFRRRARRRVRPARDGQRHRRFDPHPCIVLRSRRFQATIRPGPGPRPVSPRPVLPRRTTGPHRFRLRLARERDRRAALA